MTYAVSDIHGHYDKFAAMLGKINFGDNDTMYVIGDIIDRGNDGIKLLLEMLRMDNIVMLAGNHEDMALRALVEIVTGGGHVGENTVLWTVFNGGEPTLNEFLRLDEDEEFTVLRCLRELPIYMDVNVGGRDFVLSHSVPDNFSPCRPLKSYSRKELLWGDFKDADAEYFPDKHLIFGHTPTFLIHERPEIFRKSRLIGIDCGCTYPEDGGRLGCLCLDTLEEFYV